MDVIRLLRIYENVLKFAKLYRLCGNIKYTKTKLNLLLKLV